MDNHALEVHMTRDTPDRKSTWQEVRQWTTIWPWEEGKTDVSILKIVPEAKESNQSQRTLTRHNQSDTQNKDVLIKLRRNIQL